MNIPLIPCEITMLTYFLPVCVAADFVVSAGCDAGVAAGAAGAVVTGVDLTHDASFDGDLVKLLLARS